jgi:hypothetical protein
MNDDPISTLPPVTTSTLLASVTDSVDWLFFISYRASGTLRP